MDTSNYYLILVSLFIGYSLSLFCGPLIGNVIDAFWEMIPHEQRYLRYKIQTKYLGMAESLLYTIVFYFFLNDPKDLKELLLIPGAWLTLKTLPPVWEKKSEGRRFGDEKYNIFLIGSLLNIFVSFIGGIISFLFFNFCNFIILILILYLVPIFALIYIKKDLQNNSESRRKFRDR